MRDALWETAGTVLLALLLWPLMAVALLYALVCTIDEKWRKI